ncbi:MAG: hypothetical protein HY901_28575 [Deltaproteobacteria bacterium]|nr:hypothetical protein [Deltaproteobacteria bacterium]
MRPTGFAVPILAALLFGACASCDEAPKTQQVSEEASVVQGTPAVDTAKPTVQVEPPVAPAFELNVPRQCDFFQQNAVRKVDILWVVDNSGSMKTSQANLASEFPRFIQSLLALQPPVDFHIGVTSTDVDNEKLNYDIDRDGPILPKDTRGTRGELHGFDLTDKGGETGRYLACNEKGECNVPKTGGNIDAAAAFAQMSKVGTAGSAIERGLQAAYLALTREDNQRAESPISTDLSKKLPFIRPDAALFVIFVSDEDDSSCAPFVPLNANGRPVSGEPCTADPGCRCDSAHLTWGSAQYFTRFLESYKGFGHKDLVAAGAVVCTEKQPISAQSGDPAFPHLGCPDQGPDKPAAYYGDRFIQVAAATGGTAISIRGSFANALQSLGFAVSGLRKDFRLSRGPFTDTLEVYVSEVNATQCTSDAECDGNRNQKCRSGACATLKVVEARSLTGCTPTDSADKPGLEYCKCESASFRNILRFNEDGQPPAQSSIEVCYDVNSNFNQVCQ